MIEDPDELAVIRTLRDPASLGWRRGCGARALSALCSRHRPPWRLDGVTWFVDMKPRQLEWLTSVRGGESARAAAWNVPEWHSHRSSKPSLHHSNPARPAGRDGLALEPPSLPSDHSAAMVPPWALAFCSVR